ncbi:MAG TPA: ABC transporter permease [Vicinamibacterales bacterium]|nr:ABC transporter permease [Vicinamibacterales bacterium]
MSQTGLRVFISRLLDVVLRSGREQRLAEEIHDHLAALTEQYIAAGMSDVDARQAARRAFGGVDQVKMLHREQRGLPSIDWLLFDMRTAVRVLGKDRWFTAGVVLVLGLGLAVNTTIFTIVNGMTWRTLPVERGDRIVQISSQRLQGRRAEIYTSYADFRDWRAATRTLSDLAAYGSATMNLGDDARPADRLAGNFISSNTFALLGVQPVVGRDFTVADDAPGAASVAILGHHIWTARYAAHPAIVGRAIRINGTATAVIGVMPEGFQFPVRADVWRPLGQMPGLDVANRGQRQFDIVGRLQDAATVEDARAELRAITAALAAQDPATNADVGATTMPFTHAFVAPPPEAQEPLVMMIAAALVLLIACANGANLLLARASQRAREMAIRATLGASRFRIVRQLLVEASLIAAGGAVVGLALSGVAVGVFVRETVDLNLPFWIAFEFDLRVFVYVAVATLGTAVAFGLAPAWQLSRTNAHDVLKEGGRGAIGGRRVRRWTGALLVSELALTLTLLGSAGMLVRSSAALGSSDDLLDLDELFVAQIGLPAGRYNEPEQRRALHALLQERFDTTPLLPSATLSSVRPFVESNTRELQIAGQPNLADRRPTVQTVGAGDHYFETLGIRMLRGRQLRPDDGAPGREAVVINERFAEIHFPNVDPIGRRIRLTEPRSDAAATGHWFTIVGVSPSIRQRTMSGVAPLAYLPLDVHLGPTLGVIARGGGDLPRATTALREQVRVVDPDVAAYGIMALRRLSELSRWPARMVSFVLALFAVIASLLSMAGLYGLTAYGVAQRTSEIGLRIALGASRAQIAWRFLRTTLVHVTVGLVIGLAGVLAAGQLLRGLLVEIGGADPMVLAGIVVAVVSIAASACAVPTRRAVRLDPVAALRHE